MKRIRNSVKAIIISLCLVVVLAGSIVGVVLANNKNGGKGGNNNSGGGNSGGSLPQYELTEDQKVLADAVNKNANTSVELATEFDSTSYVDENGDPIDYDSVHEINDNYIVVSDSYGSNMYVKKTSGNAVFYHNVSSLTGVSGEIASRYCSEYHNGLVFIKYVLIENSVYNYYGKVYDVKNDKLINSFIINDIGSDYLQNDNFDFIFSRFMNNCYALIYPEINGDDTTLNIKIFNYESNAEVKSYEFEIQSEIDDDMFSCYNDNFYFLEGDYLTVGYYDGSRYFDCNFEINSISDIFLCGNTVFVEQSIEIEDPALKNELTIGYINYNYKVLDLKTGLISDFELLDGYAKAKFEFVFDKYIQIYQEKYLDEEAVGGYFKYCDASLNEIITYEATTINDRIHYNYDSNFLTTKGILTTKKSINTEYVVEFDIEEFDYSLQDYYAKVNGNSFLICDNSSGRYKLMNMSGQFVFDKVFHEIYSYDEGYYFGFDGVSAYILNSLEKQIIEVSNYNRTDNYFILMGGGIYLTKADEVYTLFDYKGNEMLSDILSYEYSSSNNKSYLILDCGSYEKIYVLNKPVYLPNENGEEVITYNFSDFDLYDDTQIDRNGSSGGFLYMTQDKLGDDKSCWKVTLTSSDLGYYISYGYISIGRNDGTKDTTNHKVWFSHSGVSTSYYGSAWFTDSTPKLQHNTDKYMYAIYGNASDGDNTDGLSAISITRSKVYFTIYKSNLGYGNGCHPATGAVSATSVDYDESITPGTVYMNGFTWKGWKSSVSYLSGEGTSNDGYYTQFKSSVYWMGDSTTIQAGWSANTYNITYYLEAGSGHALKTDSYTTSTSDVTKSYIPERKGYTFLGWNWRLENYANYNGTNCYRQATYHTPAGKDIYTKFVIPSGSYGDLELEATWRSNVYTVNLNFGSWTSAVPTRAEIFTLASFNEYGFTNGGRTPISPTTGQLYAKYNKSYTSTNSGSNVVIYGSALSFKFKYHPGYDEGTDKSPVSSLEEKLYSYLNLTSSGLQNKFNPKNESHFAFESFNLPYQIVDWAYFTKSKDTSKNLYKLLSADINNEADYVYTFLNTSGSAPDYISANGLYYDRDQEINLYAVYEPRDYKVAHYDDLEYGKGSLVDNAASNGASNWNSGYVKNYEQSIETEWKYNTNTNAWGVATYIPALKQSDELKVKIDIKNGNDASKYEEYFIFDRVEILKIGYKEDASTYYYGKFVLTCVENSVGNYSTNIQAFDRDGNEISGGYVLDGDYVYINSASASNEINGIHKNSGFKDGGLRFEIDFLNLGYAAYFENGTDFQDSSRDLSHYGVISNASVSGDGKLGFTMKAYYRPYYVKKDNVSMEYSSGDSDTGNINQTDMDDVGITYDIFQQSFITPIQSLDNAVKITEHASESNAHAFWINGRFYILCDVTNNPINELTSGFYNLTTTKVSIYSFNGKQNYNAAYIAKAIDKSVAGINGDNSLFNVFNANDTNHDGSVVYCEANANTKIIRYLGGADYVSEYVDSSVDLGWYETSGEKNPNEKANYINYNSSQIIAIVPEQNIINVSKDPITSLGSNNSDIASGGGTYYELVKYLNKIKIGNIVCELAMTREVDKKGNYYLYGHGLYEDISRNVLYDDGSSITKLAVGETWSVVYFEETYRIMQAYQILVKSDNGDREYVLYLTVREDGFVIYFLHSEPRYKIVSDNIDAPADNLNIVVTFSEINTKININVTDVEQIQGTASVQIFDTKFNNSEIYVTDDKTNDAEFNATLDNEVGRREHQPENIWTSTEYLHVVNPQDLRIVKITPIDGFLINKVTLRIVIGKPDVLQGNGEYADPDPDPNNETDYHEYDDIIVTYFYFYNFGEITYSGGDVTNGDYFTYIFANPDTSKSEYRIKYFAKNNTYFDAYDKGSTSIGAYQHGVYYFAPGDAAWSISTNNSGAGTYPAFETIFFMISGMYNDVVIDVETMSFMEFGFVDDQSDNYLGFDVNKENPEYTRYQKDDNGNYNKTNTGEYLLHVNNIQADIIQSYLANYVSGDVDNYKNNRYLSSPHIYRIDDDGNGGEELVPVGVFEPGKEYKCDEGSRGDGRYGESALIKLYFKSGNNYLLAYYGGCSLDMIYDIDELNFKGNLNYQYLFNDEKGNNKNNYFLSDIKNLSMLITEITSEENPSLPGLPIFTINDIKLGTGSVWLENENSFNANFGMYDASFVSTLSIVNGIAGDDGLMYRVIFLGKSKLFEGGVKIFASGEDYSAYFTNILTYNDDGNDAAATAPLELTASQLLSDAEGRDNYYLPLDSTENEIFVPVQMTTKNFEMNDNYTFIQIDSLQDYFNYTLYARTDGNPIGINKSDIYYTSFEYSRKYFTAMAVKPNYISMTMNSYISNDEIEKISTTQTDYYKLPGWTENVNLGLLSTAKKWGSDADKLTIKADTRFNAHFDGSEGNYNFSPNVGNAELYIDDADENKTKLRFTPYSPVMWVGNSQPTAYQLDYVDLREPDANGNKREYYKTNSWFNDTILTNIDYNFNKKTATTKYATESSGILNWQDVQKEESSRIDGYKIEYKYYAIPGYYLDYIVVETVDFGMAYIPITDFNGKGENAIISGKLFNGEKIYYSLEKFAGEVIPNSGDPYNEYYYELKLYLDSGDENDIDNLNSLAILSNNITVNFFSKAYDVQITYHSEDKETSTKISSQATISGATAENMQTFAYDTIVTLSAYATMTGYTFVGWGSPDADEKNKPNDYELGRTRYDISTNYWSSASLWMPVTGVEYEQYKKNDNYFDNNNRQKLLALETYGYDFYVKSLHDDRRNITGYFITDTGYSVARNNGLDSNASAGVQENYNFWSAYSEVFKSKFVNNFDLYRGSAYEIDMWAIWKADVYSVQLNFNDLAKASGSTDAQFAQYDKSFIPNSLSRVGYKWNGDITVTLGSATDILGNLTNRINGVQGNGVSTQRIYYAYVEFDTNDWYLIPEEYIKTNFSEIVSHYSYKSKSLNDGDKFNAGILDFNYLNDGTNKLEFVLDRYGYSWLGWFSDKLAPVYEKTSVNNKYNNDNRDLRVFGSDYYYTNNYSGNITRKMPYLRNISTNIDETNATTVIHYNDFIGANDDYNISTYSEFVYNGELGFALNKENYNPNSHKYVYHYEYKTAFEGASGVPNNGFRFENGDYLNYLQNSSSSYGVFDNAIAGNKSIFAYFDTSLTLDSYVRYTTADAESDSEDDITSEDVGDLILTEDFKVQIKRQGIKETANYKYITLYAYWLTNSYNVYIDYRDESSISINNLGSTDVTNKLEIHDASYTDNNDLTGNNSKNINSTYFDDSFFNNILQQSIPIRVGYDFIGWSFYFRDPSLYNNLKDENKAKTSLLYKYNGFTNPLSGYTLNNSTIQFEDYHYKIFSPTEQIKNEKITILYQRAYSDYDSYLNLIDDNNYTQLAQNREVYGDEEGDGNHYIYIFALWRAQAFEINVGLNIDTEDLINSYDQDSSYSIGFYDNYDETMRNDEDVYYFDNNGLKVYPYKVEDYTTSDRVDDVPYEDDKGNNVYPYDGEEIESERRNASGYVGINSLFLKQKKNASNISEYGDVFTEVISNLTFVIYFDDPFSSAMFADPNANVTRYYYLKDLFAVSAGYYLINWLYHSNDPNSYLIANSLMTEFDYNSSIVNRNELGEQSIIPTYKQDESYICDVNGANSVFNEDWHNRLKNSNYKDMTGQDAEAEGSIFDADNNNIYLKNLNISGASTNFGYVVIKEPEEPSGFRDIRCYIYPEYIESFDDGSGERTTATYNLYFKYKGEKFYLNFYVNAGSGANASTVVLTNDLAYLYYPVSNTERYIIRFDSNGQAYYVPNSAYETMVELDIQIAVFTSANIASLGNTEHINNGTYDLFVSHRYMLADDEPFKVVTTRQFSIYAHWQMKEDFELWFTNDNNLLADDNLLKDDANAGLAGYYAAYLNGSVTSMIETQTEYDAGGENNVMKGEDLDRMYTIYQFYDDIQIEMMPFFNGRYLTELYFDFDRIEDINLYGNRASYNSPTAVLTSYQLVKYRLIFNFNWDNEAHKIILSEISLHKYKYDEHNGWGFVEEVASIAITSANSNTLVSGVSGYENYEGTSMSMKIDAEANGANTLNSELLSTYLSLLEIDGFIHKEFLSIFAYGEYYGRRDVNKVVFKTNDLLTNMYITCKYSVQTYQLNVHHVFDSNGDTLTQSSFDTSIYTTEFSELANGVHYEEENSLISSNAYLDKTATGMNQALATIHQDLATENYNVPYGYFIYGTFYDDALVGYRPMDDYYGSGHTINPDDIGTTEHVFDGFNYIYWDGNYYKGQGNTEKLRLNGGEASDLYEDQGSPLLGSSARFPEQSIRYNKSLYLFKGWYESLGTQGGATIIFSLYDQAQESTYIHRNITLYGYYYANNSPTNIQFYTWNNNWSESDPAYVPYTNNTTEYTLSSVDDSSPFTVVNRIVYPNDNAQDFIDETGRMKFRNHIEFGVDSSAFSLDEFNSLEISRNSMDIVNNILKTYWYYEETYTVLYAENLDGMSRVYIKYDPMLISEYEYVPFGDDNENDGMIVWTEEYESYVKGEINTFSIFATIKDGVVNVVSPSREVSVEYSTEYEMYYFLNPVNNKYLFFDNSQKNVIKTKLFEEKDIFYYEYVDGGTKYRKVKVVSSVDLKNTQLAIWNGTGYDTDSDDLIDLIQEPVYLYGKKFTGADLYAVYKHTDNKDRYYKYHRVPESVIDDPSATEFLRKFEPRYYVDFEGTRYYTMLHLNESNKTGGKHFNEWYDVNGNHFDLSFVITTLKNNFVLVDDVYYEINFEEKSDGGSIYYNPYLYQNTVTFPYDGVTKTYYFNYENHSRTSGLYETYSSGEFKNAVIFEYNIYSPINQNYTLNAALKAGKWEPSDITLNTFPSLNLDYWMNNPENVLLGYINVSNTDIDVMKQNSANSESFSNSEYSYIASINSIVNTNEYQEYINNGSQGEFTGVFAKVEILQQKLIEVSTGNQISLFKDEDSNDWYFSYVEDDGSTNYYYFDPTKESDVVEIKHKSGGQIYMAFMDYINEMYGGDEYTDLRVALEHAINGKISEYSFADMIKSPLSVVDYQLSTIDKKTIEQVIMRISVQFVFSQGDIEEYGLENFCDVPGLAVEVANGEYQITLSTTFNYAFSLITKKTQITSNIYAVPIYAPDVIKFVNQNNVTTGSHSYSGAELSVDISKMQVTHFDIESLKLYQSTYVWDIIDSPELISLADLADYLQFVVLNQDQQNELIASNIGCDVKLDSMITSNDLDIGNDLTIYSEQSLGKDNTILTFDFASMEDGTYYLYSFYYTINTATKPTTFTYTNGDGQIVTINYNSANQTEYEEAFEDGRVISVNYNKHINRVSNNYLKVVVNNGAIIDVVLEKNTVTQ